jgi:hypothetical protein
VDKTDIYNIPGRLCVDFDKTSFDTVETHFISADPSGIP